MMKCSKCKRDIFGEKCKEKGKWGYWVGGAAVLMTGPVGAAGGAVAIGAKLFNKYIMDEVVIKCPHCGAKLTLTRAEWKELKNEMYRLEEQERKNKQNRIER